MPSYASDQNYFYRSLDTSWGYSLSELSHWSSGQPCEQLIWKSTTELEMNFLTHYHYIQDVVALPCQSALRCTWGLQWQRILGPYSIISLWGGASAIYVSFAHLTLYDNHRGGSWEFLTSIMVTDSEFSIPALPPPYFAFSSASHLGACFIRWLLLIWIWRCD